jgi:hypothetical protein
VRTICNKLRTGFLLGQAGDAIHDLVRDLSISQALHGALQFEHLLRRRPLYIPLQLAAGCQRAAFQTPVPFLHRLGSAKSLDSRTKAPGALFGRKEGLNVLAHLGLIVFYHPDIVTPAFHNLQGEVTLRQLRVPRHDFAT